MPGRAPEGDATFSTAALGDLRGRDDLCLLPWSAWLKLRGVKVSLAET